MHRDVCAVVGKYFPGLAQKDTIFIYYEDYQRMVLWSTYPELNIQQIEIIEELLIQDATAEQILEIMQLEDRDEKMRQIMEDISSIPRSHWRGYVKDEILASHCRGYWGISNEAEALLNGEEESIMDDTITMNEALDKLESLSSLRIV